MNLRIVAYVMGRLLYALTIAILIPFFAALVWHEPVMNFGITFFISLFVAGICTNQGELPEDKLSLREGIAVTGIGWFIASIITSLPFMLGTDMSIADCLFEGTSGITGTGGTIIDDLTSISDSLILWRSLAHWLGGIGIIVIFIAIFPQPGNGSMYMFFAEGSGPISERIMPRIKTTANALLTLYIVLTIALTAVLIFICDIAPFNALNTSMSAIATGGFSDQNGSIGNFNSLTAEISIMIFMLIGGGNFGLYFMAWRKGIRCMWQNTEFRVYIGIFTTISLLITLNLATAGGMDWNYALRYATFQTASVLTTTGFTTTDFDQWPTFSKLCLLLLMFTGGCAGSTSGGMKLTRLIILFKMIYTFILKILHPRSIIHIKLDHKKLPDNVAFQVARFFFIYIMLCLVLGIIVSLDGVPAMDAIAIGISTMANAGVAFGVASGSFSVLPPVSKLTCCIFMILGRLEIFTLLAMFQPEFWRRGNW